MNATPLLLLSSGATPRYLEDIVRALALPDSAKLQFRYERDIVATNVWNSVPEGPAGGLTGHVAYLAYLDNRETDREPTFVPVREAEISSARKVGNSLIISLDIRRYIETHELGLLTKQVEANAQASLPKWKKNRLPDDPNPFEGYWVNFLNSPIPENKLHAHDASGISHIKIFEETVSVLVSHRVDFDTPEKRLFYNVLGLKHPNGDFVLLRNGTWSTQPGHVYRLVIYHFRPKEETHAPVNVLWLGARLSGEGIERLGPEHLRIDSGYDEKVIDLVTSDSFRGTKSSVTLSRTSNPDDIQNQSAEVIFNIEVKASLVRPLLQVVIIAVGISGPALIAASARLPTGATLSWWETSLIFLGGVAAAIASVWGFKRAA